MYLKLGRVPTIVVSSSELAKQVLKTHDLKCCSRPQLVALDKLSYGFSDIGFNSYGQKWRELRKITIIEFFSNVKVHSPRFRSVREEEVDRMVRSIASLASSSLDVNLSEMMQALNSNLICRIGFGKSYVSELAEMKHVFKEAQAISIGTFFADYIPMVGWIIDVITGMQSRLRRTFSELDKFYCKIIDDHIHDKMNDTRKDRDDGDIVDALLQMRKNGLINDESVKGIIMNILIAGTDTSSATIVWTMTELMLHPEVMRKAQDEVRGRIGRKRLIEESDLDKFQYLKVIIKETMRVHPIVPLLVTRETMEHFKLNGYDIPAKAMLIINTWVIARDANYWEKPEEFNPDRFVEPKDYDFNLIPFGEGRRSCPGKNLGLVTVELVLANLLYCFDWNLPCGMRKEDINLDEAPGITVHKKDALCLMANIYDGMEA